MNRQRCPPPTDEPLRSITAFIRSGGFPLVAGVSRERFEQWLQLGSITKGKTTPYRTFPRAVRQAVAEARLKAASYLGRYQVSHHARQAVVQALPPRSIFQGAPAALWSPTVNFAVPAGKKVV
jgi:hypothetical protein